jgi:hypothetical protein
MTEAVRGAVQTLLPTPLTTPINKLLGITIGGEIRPFITILMFKKPLSLCHLLFRALVTTFAFSPFRVGGKAFGL